MSEQQITPEARLAREAGARPASLFSQAWCGLGAGVWLVVFAWLWVAAPPLGQTLGLGWFALGALWPTGFVYSLALAFPWFGNNPGGPNHLYLLEMGMMGLAAGYLARRAWGAIRPRPNRLDPWVFGFVALSWMSMIHQWQWFQAEFEYNPKGFFFTIFNHYGTANVFGLQLALKLTLAAALYALLRDRPWSARRLERLWAVLLGAAAFTALVGWLNYAKVLPLGWWRTENEFIEARFGWPRLQSLYWHAGWLAQYLEALAPGALALALAARRKSARWGMGALTALLVVTQFFTMARAGWIGLAGGCAAVVAAATLCDGAHRRREEGAEAGRKPALARLGLRLGALAGVLLLMTAALALTSHDLRHRVGELFAYQHRSGIWKSAVSLFLTHPFCGIGMGSYFTIVRQIFPAGHPYFAADNITAHNLYLHLAAERGLITLAAFLGLAAAALCGIVRGLRDATGAARAVRLALLGGLVALLIDGLFQYIFYVRAIELIFWLFVAWGVTLNAPPARTPRLAWGCVALLIIAMAGVVARTWGPHLLEPLPVEVRGTLFTVGRTQEVRLALPPDAKRIRLNLASLVPEGEKMPPTDTLEVGGQTLRQVAFKEFMEKQMVELDLPPTWNGKDPLTIRSTRTWSLWMYGYRDLPYARMGVLYTPPEKIR